MSQRAVTRARLAEQVMRSTGVTGERVFVPARRVTYFRAGKLLRSRLSERSAAGLAGAAGGPTDS